MLLLLEAEVRREMLRRRVGQRTAVLREASPREEAAPAAAAVAKVVVGVGRCRGCRRVAFVVVAPRVLCCLLLARYCSC